MTKAYKIIQAVTARKQNTCKLLPPKNQILKSPWILMDLPLRWLQISGNAAESLPALHANTISAEVSSETNFRLCLSPLNDRFIHVP